LFNEINGIPAHPLLVHFAIVFVLLLVAGSAVYVLVPPVRRKISWAVVLLAVVGPLCAWFAKMAGDNLKAKLFAANPTAAINAHQHNGELTEYFSLGLGVAVLLFVLVAVARGRAPKSEGGDGGPMPKRSKGAMIATVGLGAVVLALAVLTAIYVTLAGDTGAHLVWPS
jgi:uncharacterized membrane protein